jgi:hypothetical protein
MSDLTPEQRDIVRASMRNNYRLLRPIFKSTPKPERHELKMAYRFGPNYYFVKWLSTQTDLTKVAVQ